MVLDSEVTIGMLLVTCMVGVVSGREGDDGSGDVADC